MDVTENFPEEVTEMIFRQLKAKDLKKAMLVSPVWNDQIGNSAQCMKNFNLQMICDSKTFENDAEEILKSRRKFPNIQINDSEKNHIEIIYKVVKEKHELSKLKSVEVYSSKFATSSEFVKFFEVFEVSVEEIVLQGIAIEKLEKTPLNFRFPKLKSLKVMYCDQNIVIDMFLSCSTFESLTVGNSKVKPTDSAAVIEMLRRCTKLKKLDLNAETYSIVFSKDVCDLPFNLVDFSITNFGSKIKIEETIANFKKFLQAQSKTIKKLYLCDFFGTDILRFVFQMKFLKELKMFHLPLMTWDPVKIHPSASIEFLDIISTDIKNKTRIKCLLKAVPNAKRLRMRSMDVEVALFIKQNLKKIQRIYMLNPLQSNLGGAKEVLSHVRFC